MVADAAVIGTGIIGLTTAIALADRGVQVTLLGRAHRGEASSAAGGMLAPSVEAEVARGPANVFARAARDGYPAYVEALSARTGVDIPLNRLGILEVAATDAEATTLRERAALGDFKSLVSTSVWLDARALADLEPALAPLAGGFLHPEDGAVDPLRLLDALRIAAAQHHKVTVVTEDVCYADVSNGRCMIRTDSENRVETDHLVVAAGAWAPLIEGIPHPPPVTPVRGQMLGIQAAPLRHVVFGAGGYVIPKTDGMTTVGSTTEAVGFDPETTEAGLAHVRRIAETLVPELAQAEASAAWAGLRPLSPDMLPIIGRDRDAPQIVYACGHSRNGILLGPLTGEVVADLVSGREPQYDLSQFRPDRF